MKTVLLQSRSSHDIELLVGIAKKMGVNVKPISENDKEDFAMLLAIKSGRTHKLIDTDKFIKGLKK